MKSNYLKKIDDNFYQDSKHSKKIIKQDFFNKLATMRSEMMDIVQFSDGGAVQVDRLYRSYGEQENFNNFTMYTIKGCRDMEEDSNNIMEVSFSDNEITKIDRLYTMHKDSPEVVQAVSYNVMFLDGEDGTYPIMFTFFVPIVMPVPVEMIVDSDGTPIIDKE